MKYLLTIVVLLAMTCLVADDLQNRTADWFEQNPDSLPQWMTPDELLRLDEIGIRLIPTDPPPAPVRAAAEFEPAEGVLIRYPLGIPLSLIANLSQHTTVVTIVSSTYYQNQAIASYNNGGVNLDNCEFMIAPTDSYWTRDYSPFFIFDGNNEMAVVDFSYNRPRPSDDNIPSMFASHNQMSLYGMNIVHVGGNYMTDGMGVSVSSHIVYSENNNYSHTQVDNFMRNFMGIDTHIVVQDPNNTYIDHIDCWGKFLAPDKILIRSVPASHSQYDSIENIVDYFGSLTSSYGTPYKIYRVYTPNNQPYTNSLILNDKVYVPTVNSTHDAAAIAAYQAAMPGYEIIGIYSNGWMSTDALHCRTKEITDRNMLYIKHLPILNEQPFQNQFHFDAYIYPYSGAELYQDSLRVYYSINDGDYQHTVLLETDDNEYSASINGISSNDTISYYIYAADTVGKRAKHPFIGSSDPHIFTVGENDLLPQIIHEPLAAFYYDLLPVTIEAVISDGVTAAFFQYSINGDVHHSIPLTETADNVWTCFFGEELEPNDIVEYRFFASDAEEPPNSAFYPVDGWFETIVAVRQLATPSFIPEPGIYQAPVIVEISYEQGTLYYTTDNSNPDSESTIYQSPILVDETAVIKAIVKADRFLDSEQISGEFIITNLGIDNPILSETRLNSVYPNPFNPDTNISFITAKGANVKIEIFNLKGQIVKTLVDNYFPVGEHSIKWNGRSNNNEELPSSIYLCRMSSDDYNGFMRLVLLK